MSEIKVYWERETLNSSFCPPSSALYGLVCRLSESTQSDFRRLCDRFDTSPSIQIAEETRIEIVEGVYVIGWDRIGQEFFEQLGKLLGIFFILFLIHVFEETNANIYITLFQR